MQSTANRQLRCNYAICYNTAKGLIEMPRKSVKENKSVYQQAREELQLTRDMASELMSGMTADRIEKIENGRTAIQPEDVLIMAKCYKAPNLCNHYCSQECVIGQEYVPEVKIKSLSQIAIETVNSLGRLNRARDRILEIVEDGEVTPDEYADFFNIKESLDKISLCVGALQLWIDEQIANGKLNKPE